MNEDCIALLERWPLAGKFNLTPGSIAVVAGSYEGRVMELLLELYPGIIVYGFDPQSWACEAAIERLQKYNKSNWFIVPEALGENISFLPMGEWHTDAASFINTGPNSRLQGEGRIIEFDLAMKIQSIEQIELFIMNMEAFEYKLLPHIINNGWLNRIQKLAVQFHFDLGVGGPEDMENLLRDMSQTHNIVYDERPSWVYLEKI